MAVRITASTDGPTNTVRIEGRLDEADLPDLLSDCLSKEGLKLDLGGLQSADKAGVRALRWLVAAGAEVCHASPTCRGYSTSRMTRRHRGALESPSSDANICCMSSVSRAGA